MYAKVCRIHDNFASEVNGNVGHNSGARHGNRVAQDAIRQKVVPSSDYGEILLYKTGCFNTTFGAKD